MFPHLKNYRSIRQNTDCLFVGGTGASSYIKEIGSSSGNIADLSVAPMSTSYMSRVVKNYHSYLKKNGEVALLLNPFSLCIRHYEGKSNISKDIRFYPILHNAMIENFDSNISDTWSRKLAPKSMRILAEWLNLTFTKYTIKNEETEVLTSLKNEVDENNELSQSLKDTIEDNVSYIKQLQMFLSERDYSLKVIVMKDVLKGTTVQRYDSILDDVLYRPLKNAQIEVKV